VRPLTVPTLFQLGGCLLEQGKARLWAGNESGVAQSADVAFDTVTTDSPQPAQ